MCDGLVAACGSIRVVSTRSARTAATGCGNRTIASVCSLFPGLAAMFVRAQSEGGLHLTRCCIFNLIFKLILSFTSTFEFDLLTRTAFVFSNYSPESKLS